MSSVEIPLLRESAAYATRLVAAARAFAQPAYHGHRRVSGSCRLGESFYVRESRRFGAAPDDYLAGRVGTPSTRDDVYPQRLRWKQTLVVLAKVMAHWSFEVLTLKQQQYYRAVRPCQWQLRRLDVKLSSAPGPAVSPVGPMRGIDLVVLSQSSGGSPGLIEENEALLVNGPTAPAGFELLTDLHRVNARAGTVFVSFCSTCQIDPSFVGLKILVRGHLIHPEISFDDSEEIVGLLQSIALMRALATGAAAAPAPGMAAVAVSD